MRLCIFKMYVWGSHLYLYFDYNAHILGDIDIWKNTFTFVFWLQCTHILEDVRAFRESHLHLYFGCNTHLFWRRYTLKYNCIHIFTKKLTLIKHYFNLYHISSMIKENKTNLANWIHEPHPNSITSYFR